MATQSLHPESALATLNVPVADIERMERHARVLEGLLMRADYILATIFSGNMITSNPTDNFEREANNNASALLSFLQDDLKTREQLEGTDLSIQLACLAKRSA